VIRAGRIEIVFIVAEYVGMQKRVFRVGMEG